LNRQENTIMERERERDWRDKNRQGTDFAMKRKFQVV